MTDSYVGRRTVPCVPCAPVSRMTFSYLQDEFKLESLKVADVDQF